MDGIKAQRLLLKGANASATFVGFAEEMGHKGGERAFCFSMPRPSFEVNGRGVDTVNTSSDMQEKDKEKLQEIGSLRVNFHETVLQSVRTEVSSHSQGSSKRGDGVDFTPTDKKTAKSVGSTAAVRAGPTLPGSRAVKGSAQGGGTGNALGSRAKTHTVTYYASAQDSNKVATARIRFATKEKLDDMGLIDLDR